MYKQIEIKSSPVHGKGVFSTTRIKAGTELTCDVIKIDPNYLYRYHYPYGDKKDDFVICIGFGSFLNHSRNPNIKFVTITDDFVAHFTTIRDIKKGEELMLKYPDGFEQVMQQKGEPLIIT